MIETTTRPHASQILKDVERQLAQAQVPLGEGPSMNTAREAVDDIWQSLNSIASLVPAQATELATRSLLSSFGSFEALARDDVELATDRLVEAVTRVMREMSEAYAVCEEIDARSNLASDLEAAHAALDAAMRQAADKARTSFEKADAEVKRLAEVPPEAASNLSELLAVYSQAVTERLSRESAEGRARSALRSLMSHLQLGQDETARMFGVSGETIRRWERGKTTISAARASELLEAEAELERLLEMFRLERLPMVLRREASLFDGESALDWILRGRIAEVADFYEQTLSYQG